MVLLSACNMESWENLFASGKFVECLRMLETLLNTDHTSSEDDVRLSFHIQHNKIISEALSYDWFEDEVNVLELHQAWCKILMELTNLCDTLRCDLLTSDFSQELYLVTTLNLLFWTWENMGDDCLGHIDKMNKLTIVSFQTELSSCGESTLNTHDLFGLIKLYKQCMWRIPPQRCHILFDIISLSLLHKLQFGCSHQWLSECLTILEGFNNCLPQINLHFTSTTGKKTENAHPLFRLGPNIASSEGDPNLSINLFFVVTILYLLELKLNDKAWEFLEKKTFATHEKFEVLFQYLRALVSLRRNDFERCAYHLKCLSSVPLEIHMIKRKNILNGWLHILKGNHENALQTLRDNTGLPQDEDQIPIHVYLMARSYGASGQSQQQLVLLNCIVEVLREDPRYGSCRVTPISSLEDRLLRCVHRHPELSLFQNLLALAEVSMKTSQLEDACSHLLEALRLTKCSSDFHEKTCDFVKARSFQSVMRDAVVALLKSGDFQKAQILCCGLMEPHIFEKETFLSQAISMILSTDVQPDSPAEKKQEILLKAIQLLKKQRDVSSDDKSQALIDSLTARAFFRKAKIFANSGLTDDATGSFKRALALKEDGVVCKEYQRHLFLTGENEEARKLIRKIKTLKESLFQHEDISSEGYITINYLVSEEVKDRL